MYHFCLEKNSLKEIKVLTLGSSTYSEQKNISFSIKRVETLL